LWGLTKRRNTMTGLHQGRAKPNRVTLWVLFVLAAVVLTAFTIRAMVTRAFSPGYSAVDAPLHSEHENPTLQSLNIEFTSLAKAVTPAIVNISTTRVTKTSPEMLDPFLRDPFFRHFFGPDFFRQMPREQRTHALGSGVIVGRDGFIVTNNH